MIKNIVFDMGNVILRWNPEYIASRLSNNLDEQKIIIKELNANFPKNLVTNQLLKYFV